MKHLTAGLMSLVWAAALAPHTASAADEDHVVEILTTSQTWDAYRPWVKASPGTTSWQGVVVDDRWILTPARAVADATLLRVVAFGSADRVPARLVHVEPDLDLAIITVDQDDFFDELVPVKLAKKIWTEGTVRTAAWRDRQLEAAEGRIGRIEVRTSAAGVGDAAQVNLTTDLSGGGKGEAVFRGKQLAGMVVSQAGKTARMLPSPIVATYLHDVHQTVTDQAPYRGVPVFYARWQVHRDMATASWLGQDSPQGVILREVFAQSTSCGVLRPRDVLLAVDGMPIDGNGRIEDAVLGNLRFERWLSEGRHIGDQVPVSVLRDGKRLELVLTLKGEPADARLVPRRRVDHAPPYVVAGGLVLRELDEDYLTAWGSNWRAKVGPRLAALWDIGAQRPEPQRRRLVVLAYVLPDAYNVGYHDVRNVIVHSINGQPIDSLPDALQALAAPEGGAEGFHVLRVIGNNPGMEQIVLDAAGYDDANQRIANAYEVPALQRLDDADERTPLTCVAEGGKPVLPPVDAL